MEMAIVAACNTPDTTKNERTHEYQKKKEGGLHPAVSLGLATALLAHGAIILSLPPVLRQRGAPFLPTASKGLDSMFREIKKQSIIAGGAATSQSSSTIPVISTTTSTTANASRTSIASSKSCQRKLQFFDLGSGDGRVVFRAAREGIFEKSIGFEINPVLHGWACMRRIIQAKQYWSTTDFYLRDLWKVDLSNADVVAVYGLHPIMGKLGGKMERELKDGCIVVSNIFPIPGWSPVTVSQDGIHVYSIPFSIKTWKK